MIPIDAPIVYFETKAFIGVPHPVQVREGEPGVPIHLVGYHVRFAGGKDDLVLTPRGPRRREQVHRVGPGEALRQNEDGTYTVVPKDAPPGLPPKGQPKKEK